MSLIERVRFYPTSLKLRAQLLAARQLLFGPHRWQAMDRLGIPGHGTDLMRIDFPPPTGVQSRWGYHRPPHPELAARLAVDAHAHRVLLGTCLSFASDWMSWPAVQDPVQPASPWRQNEFLTALDQVSLYGVLRHLQPQRYVEIGSGMSTRIAAQARRMGGFPMEIVSIDPEPRLEVAHLCDRVFRRRLEEMTAEVLGLATPRSVVFFDGTHRCFPGSDVTVFFLEVLPRLPAGTVIHIHDIFLPADYPAGQLRRFWSEQYILAAFLLGGGTGLDVMLPCAHLATDSEIRLLIAATLGTASVDGSSFWLRKT